jgi:modulator of FtsH protease HflC
MNRNVFTLTIGCLLLLIFGLLLCVFQVRQSEVAVVTTFSKPTRPITEPGAHWKLPWPIQRVYKFDQRVQNFEETRPSEGLTSDSFNLLTSVYVGWKITDPTIFFPKFAGSADPIAEAEKGLELLLGNARSAVVGKHPLSDFVSASDNGTNFVAIENEILAAVQSQVRANNYGLDLEFLGLKRIQLPPSVTQTVFERMQSERKVLADKSQYEGEAEAQKIRSEAERKAAEVLATADYEATRIRGEGEAEAAKSLTVFQQNPELAGFIFRLNALEGSLKDRSILIFDQHTPPFDLFRGVSTNLLNK